MIVRPFGRTSRCAFGAAAGRDAEAAAADLVLDRLQQVVGLVGDGEVGVAGDAEVAVVDHIGAGEEHVEVGGDRLLQGHEGIAALADREEAAEQLLRHLYAGDDLGAALGIAEEDAEAEREVGDVGEGAAEADHQRRQRREDLFVEALVDLAALLRGGRVERDDADSLLRQLGQDPALEAALQAPVQLQHPRLDRVDLLAGREAVGPASVDPGVELVEQPGHPDHEELIQVGGVDRAEADLLEQRHARVLGQLEDPLVEVEPRELAVEIEAGIVDRPIVLPGLRYYRAPQEPPLPESLNEHIYALSVVKRLFYSLSE